LVVINGGINDYRASSSESETTADRIATSYKTIITKLIDKGAKNILILSIEGAGSFKSKLHSLLHSLQSERTSFYVLDRDDVEREIKEDPGHFGIKSVEGYTYYYEPGSDRSDFSSPRMQHLLWDNFEHWSKEAHTVLGRRAITLKEFKSGS